MKMKMHDGFVLSLLLLLCGCKSNLMYVIPPTQNGEAILGYAGKTVQWAPTGQPFQITFWIGGNPCEASDVLVSNGTNSVVCHLPVGEYGNYEYFVAPPSSSRNAGQKAGAQALPKDAASPTDSADQPTGAGPYPMRVVRCQGCPQYDVVPPEKGRP